MSYSCLDYYTQRRQMKKYNFIPYEYPKSSDGRFYIAEVDHQILASRRKQLGLTQSQVAERAGVKLPQYQRLEAGTRQLGGCSMRIGLAICAVLHMNPYTLVEINADPPDPSTMRPQVKVDIRKVEWETIQDTIQDQNTE